MEAGERHLDEVSQGLRAASDEIQAASGSAREAAANSAEASTNAAAAEAAAQQTLDFLREWSAEFAESTTKFRFWQQVLAWVLSAAAAGLALVMVFEDYNSTGGWIAVVVFIIGGITASFRGRFSIGSRSSDSATPDQT